MAERKSAERAKAGEWCNVTVKPRGARSRQYYEAIVEEVVMVSPVKKRLFQTPKGDDIIAADNGYWRRDERGVPAFVVKIHVDENSSAGHAEFHVISDKDINTTQREKEEAERKAEARAQRDRAARMAQQKKEQAAREARDPEKIAELARRRERNTIQNDEMLATLEAWADKQGFEIDFDGYLSAVLLDKGNQKLADKHRAWMRHPEASDNSDERRDKSTDAHPDNMRVSVPLTWLYAALQRDPEMGIDRGPDLAEHTEHTQAAAHQQGITPASATLGLE